MERRLLLMNTYIPKVIATATEQTPVDQGSIEEIVSDAASFEVVPWVGWENQGSEELAERLAESAALLIRTGIVDSRLLQKCKHLEIITLHGAGTDQVDVAAAKELGITVTNVPGGNARSVAEMTLGLVLSLLRNIASAHSVLVREQDWSTARQTGREIRGLKWGLVGMGHTGRETAQLARSVGCQIAYHDPHLKKSDRESLPAGWEAMSFSDLLSSSDIISIHVPLNQQTHHLIDDKALSEMKSSAYLVNVSRGGVVDQVAATGAAHRGEISGVALDVFDPEPLTEDDIQMLKGPRVLLTPHLAGSTKECLTAIAREAACDIKRVLQGESPLNAV